MPVKLDSDVHYIPMDGPWQSEQDNEAYRTAEYFFNDLKNKRDYVVLIQSHHWASQGYWVETKKKEVKYPDRILKEHTK